MIAQTLEESSLFEELLNRPYVRISMHRFAFPINRRLIEGWPRDQITSSCAFAVGSRLLAGGLVPDNDTIFDLFLAESTTCEVALLESILVHLPSALPDLEPGMKLSPTVEALVLDIVKDVEEQDLQSVERRRQLMEWLSRQGLSPNPEDFQNPHFTRMKRRTCDPKYV
jgi:hypothetical protein